MPSAKPEHEPWWPLTFEESVNTFALRATANLPTREVSIYHDDLRDGLTRYRVYDRGTTMRLGTPDDLIALRCLLLTLAYPESKDG